MSSPLPPSNGLPSTSPSKSMTTRSPVGRGMLLGRVVPALGLAGELLICSSTAFSSGSTVSRSSLRSSISRRRNVGQRLEADLHLGVLAGLIAFVELDLRLERGADLLLVQQLLDAVLDRALQRVAAQALAVHLADEVRRHLARAEAGHSDLRRDALHFLLDPRLDVLGGDGQHEGALQALVLGLDGLDGHVSQILMNSGLSRAWRGMVRAEGLEPPHLSTLGPKPSASTNSATPARTPESAAAYNRHARWATRIGSATVVAEGRSDGKGANRCNSIRPIPEEPSPSPGTPEPAQPGQPTHAPPKNLAHEPEHRRALARHAGHSAAEHADFAGWLNRNREGGHGLHEAFSGRYAGN